jgi:hypothetical protein
VLLFLYNKNIKINLPITDNEVAVYGKLLSFIINWSNFLFLSSCLIVSMKPITFSSLDVSSDKRSIKKRLQVRHDLLP